MQQSHREQRQTELESRQPFTRLPLWLRALSALPLPVWYAFAHFLAWLGEYVTHYRRAVVDAQLLLCFPGLGKAERARIRREFYRNFAEVMVEIIKALTISEAEIRRRVTLHNVAAVRAELDAGHSVITLTSHNGNWEWTLLAMSLGMGYPIHAAYKPIHGRFGDRLMLTLRGRFGARMIPAKRLLMRVLRRRREPQIVAMVADQDPVSSTVRHFTQFFGQDTAFFIGPEAIARTGNMAVFYLAVRRTARGHYEVSFEPLAARGEELPPGGLIDRYARRIEDFTRERPADWLWSYRRWKVRRPGDAGAGPADAAPPASG
ncbi:MAG: hypothetical protein EPO25_16690 [Gammaproteobacteria bacterium]|nr:MAG: hypothetical protein EPO25_16690 [Gammaproteobacteria bacterium]